MRRALGCLLAALVLLGSAAAEGTASAETQTLAEAIDQAVDGLDLTALDAADAVLSATGGLRETVRAIARGEMTLSFDEVMQLLVSRFLSAVRDTLWRLTHLAAPALIWAVLRQLSPGSRTGGQVVCALAVCGLLTQDLGEHIALCAGSVTQLSESMQGLFPILLTLMAAVGGAAGSALMQPAVVAAAGAMTGLISHVTLPLAVAAAVLSMLSHLGVGIRVERLSKVTYQAAAWALGVCFTVFIAVLATRGVTAAAVDGVTIRTAKYAINNMIPVVGGMFADTVDSLVGSGLLVESALGVTGLILIVSAAAGPMCQTLAAALLYKLAAALMQPFSGGDLADCLEDFGRILTLLFIIQLCAAAMFVMLIAQMIAVSGMTVMLR